MLARRQITHTRISAQNVDSIKPNRPPPVSLGDLPRRIGGGGGCESGSSFPWLAQRGSSALDAARRQEQQLRSSAGGNEGQRLFELGNALAKQSRWFEACDAYREAESHDIHSVEIKRNRGIALCEVGNYIEAQSVLISANELSGNSDPKVKLVLGSALLELGRIEEAVSELHACISLDASSPVAHRTLGMALHKARTCVVSWRADLCCSVDETRRQLMRCLQPPSWTNGMPVLFIGWVFLREPSRQMIR